MHPKVEMRTTPTVFMVCIDPISQVSEKLVVFCKKLAKPSCENDWLKLIKTMETMLSHRNLKHLNQGKRTINW